MKKTAFIFLLSLTSLIFASERFFLRNPALSPDAKRIAFSYSGDIWIVDSEGGIAKRLTAMYGNEYDPEFSPDGKYVAFSGYQSGNRDVYLLNLSGGDIKQLTFHSANDKVESWSWDSKFIYFTSNRDSRMTSFKVSISGGTPERIFKGFWTWAHNIFEDPETGGYYFNESWESSMFASRKGYKGDFNPDINFYNPKTDEYKELTTYNGKDYFAKTNRDGKLYFLSDEETGEFNLFTFENGKKTKLSDFDASLYDLNVAANGKLLTFVKDYQIFTYNPATNKTVKVKIELNNNDFLNNEKTFNVSGKISRFDVSPDNKKLAFVSRGQLFVSDIKGMFVKHVETNINERVMEVKWLDDNKSLLYTRTDMGWLNLFTKRADSVMNEKQLTFDKQNNQEITLDSERKKGTYISGRNELRMIDLTDFESKTLVKDEFWALYPTTPYFSPDDKFIMYTVYRDFEQDIFLYDIEKDKPIQLTKTGVTETNPYWSPNGKYIYFESDPLKANFPTGARDSEIIRIPLRKYGPEFKSDQIAKVFSDKKDSTKDPVVKLDLNNLRDRWENVITFPRNQFAPVVVKDGKKDIVLFTSNHDNEGWAIWKKVYEPFKAPKTEKVKKIDQAYFYSVTVDKNFYYVAGGKLYKLNIGAKKADEISLGYSYTKNVKSEFPQMYWETVANVGENFYDDNYHDMDWEGLKKKYSKFVPHITNRSDLRLLLADLLNELNSSHQGFYSSGKEEDIFFNASSAETGIIFSNTDPYKVERIVYNSPADNENITLMKGDVLTAVNGKKVNQKDNRNKYFEFPKRPDEISLTFKDAGTIKLKPFSSGALQDRLYTEWEKSRQEYIDELSDNKIAYVHMRNMGQSQLNHFMQEMINNAHYRKGLILDLRYNRGGNVHDAVLNFLSQKAYAQWKYRGGKFASQPNFTPSDKPIVLLINEQSLSDAEMTAAGFKELGLGKIIGTKTYAWLIFTSSKGLIDGSSYRLPSWGCYTLDGEDIEFSGVAPDIYLKNKFPDRIKNNDPQLKKAVEVILEQL